MSLADALALLRSSLPSILLAAAAAVSLAALISAALRRKRRSAIPLAPGAVPLLGNTLAVLWHYPRCAPALHPLPHMHARLRPACACRLAGTAAQWHKTRPAPTLRRLNDYLVDAARAVGMGRPFLLSLPLGQSYLALTSPAAVEHVLRTNFDNYVKGPEFASRLQGGRLAAGTPARWHAGWPAQGRGWGSD
jgi:hypothetical protein